MIRIDQTCDRVDARDLERLVLLERRENPGQAARKHRLADAGRAAEQHVVPPRRRELERTAGAFLAANVGEVERPSTRLAVADDELGRLELTAQIRHCIGEVADANRLDAGQRRLRAGVVGADETLEPCAPRAFGHGDDAADAAEAPVERELTARRVFLKPSTRNLMCRGEDGECDRQVEPRTFLLQLGRRKVHGDAVVLAGPLQLRGQRAAAHSLLCLLAGPVGQADDRERRLAELHVRFSLDASGLEADEGERNRAREHAPTLP